MPDLTIQPASKDNYISDLGVDTNHDGEDYLYSGKDSGGKIFRPLVEFDISSVYGVTEVTTATLSIYYVGYSFSDPVDRNHSVYKLLRLNWSETGSTWNSYKSGSTWTTAGADDDGDDYTSVNAVTAGIPASHGWVSWNVTAQVDDACSNLEAAAFRIKETVEASNYLVNFLSSDYSAAAYGPKLYIEYTVATPTMTTAACSGTMPTYTTANGEVVYTGGATVATRGFCYKEGASGDPTTSDSTVYDDGSGDYAAEVYEKQITSLTPSTAYRVRAYAINSEGTGYGTTVAVTTSAATVATIDTTACTGVNVTTMQGNAEITYYGGAPVTRRGFLYAAGLHDALELDE